MIDRKTKFSILILSFWLFMLPRIGLAETLGVYLESNEFTLSKTKRQKLLTILSKALEKEVIFLPSKLAGQAEIRLSTEIIESKGWVRAKYTLDQVPEFVSISLSATSQNNLEGNVAGPYSASREDSYPVEKVENAITMLLNGRLDSVVDIRGNEFYYRIKIPNYQLTTIRPSSYLFVDFRDPALADKYDSQILNFEDIADAKAIKEDSSDNRLTLIRISKVFDNDKQRLVASEDEVAASIWLKSKLSDFDIELVDTNSMATLKMLRSGANVCALNVMKNTEREKAGQFTLPSRVFLSLKLFVKKSLPQFQVLSELQKTESPIDFAKFLEQNDQGLVALPENFMRYDSLGGPLKIYSRKFPNRFIAVKRQKNFKGFSLLDQNRVDYLIEFPATLKSFLRSEREIDNFDSFEISVGSKYTETYTICSRNDVGSRAKHAIDQLIMSPQTRHQLNEFYTKGLTVSDKARYLQAFENIVENSNL